MISVIMPTYNRADLIRRSVASVVSQKGADIELIIVDDGSTDDTADVVRVLADESPVPIHYYKKENGGCASARNMGIEKASGDYIAFLDSDDEWPPDTAKRLTAVIETTGAGFVFSPATEVFEDGREILNVPVAAGRPESLATEHFMNTNVRVGGALFRTDLVRRLGGFEPALRYNEDSDFLQRAAVHATAAYQDVPAVRYNHHQGNKSRNRVAIYRALIASANTVLNESPEFARSLGKKKARRMEELKALLARALILDGNLDEAREIVSAMMSSPGISARASLFFRTSIPLRLSLKLHAARNRGSFQG